MANTLKLGAGKWATGNGTVLAFNDENNNFKPLPFTFQRASKATVVNQSGLIEEVSAGDPRIDFKDNTKGSLLLEPSRTNLIPNSENMSAWNQTSLLSITGGNVGVYGSTNAYNIIPDTTTTSHRIWLSSLGLSNNTHTFTIYAEANGCSDLYIYCNSIGVDYARWFNLETGSLRSSTGTQTSSITPIGNDWYKLEITGTSDLTSVELYLSNGTESISWTPNGTQGMLMQFGQLEVGNYATSYIPTSGSAVTRVAESSSQIPPDGVIGQTEGSIYSEFKSLDDVANIMLWMRKPSGGVYGDMIKLECGSDNRLRFEVRASNVTSCSFISDVLPTNIYYKVAVAYKQNDYVVYINGVQIGTDTSGNVPTCSEMYIGKYIDGGIRMGVSKDLKLYNTRLSNSELAALTS